MRGFDELLSLFRGGCELPPHLADAGRLVNEPTTPFATSLTADTISPMEAPLQHPAHLSVSIVLHNSDLVLLQGALSSLQSAASVAVEAGLLREVAVILVDNASTAAYRGELGQLVDHWPGSDGFSLQCEWLNANQGFGHGHNQALKGLGSDFHLVLNPDVELEMETLRIGMSFLILRYT